MKTLLILSVLLITLFSSCKMLNPDSMERSRYGMGALDLDIPKDAVKIIDFAFAKDGKGQTTKYLTYLAKDGHIYTKEYRDGLTELEGKIRWNGASKLINNTAE